jgi:hypothetical protein
MKPRTAHRPLPRALLPQIALPDPSDERRRLIGAAQASQPTATEAPTGPQVLFDRSAVRRLCRRAALNSDRLLLLLGLFLDLFRPLLLLSADTAVFVSAHVDLWLVDK